MRLGLGLLVFLFSGIAFSYPNVGDTVQWRGEVKSLNGESIPLHIVKEITRFDKKKNLWTIQTSTQVGSKKSVQSIETADIFTPEKYKAIIDSCIRKGGALERVAASTGSYDTCKTTLTTTDGLRIQQWWGNLPFGIVTKNTTDQGARPFQPEDINSQLVTF